MSGAHTRRLLIIGAGSSGLITLKYALDLLPDWNVVCAEKSDRITGCWGNPYPGFVSTTTKFATQFAAMPEYAAAMRPGDRKQSRQFFRNGEYGEYLERFAERFDLRRHIRLRCPAQRLRRSDDGGWLAVLNDSEEERFDAVVLCTGLVSKPNPVTIASGSPVRVHTDVGRLHEEIRGQTVVVCGGGESAVDAATRLADRTLGNRVYLSLRSGIRVSPRYHPVRGVPSDFLRNRLMLSIHPDLRNRLGDWFVRGRIAFESSFRRWFASQAGSDTAAEGRSSVRRRKWAMRLHLAAGEDLFDMFHNKSEDFLRGVGEGTIRIVGAPMDDSWTAFRKFGRPDRIVSLSPDVVVPVVGFRPSIEDLFDEPIHLRQFYRGCVHATLDRLYAVGFARPVIGNIPTISEVQARYVLSMLSERISRPDGLEQLAERQWNDIERRFTTLKSRLSYVQPVEMFPYCDALASDMGCFPALRTSTGLGHWIRRQLAPATTLSYADNEAAAELERATPIYLPPTLIALLMLIKPADWIYRWMKR